MVMSTRAMHVTVCQFFRSGITDRDDFDGEVQGFAGQRVVAVDMDGIAFDLGDDHAELSLRAMALELHPRLNVVHALECLARHLRHQLLLIQSIAFLRRDLDFEAIASAPTGQRMFQTIDDMARTMQITQWIAALGAIDDHALIVG